LRSGEIAGLRSDTLPYATIALVAASCVVWIAAQGAYLSLGKLVIAGPLNGDWWRLVTSPFVYGRGFSSGLFMFATLLAIAVFGGLLERRHGPFVVLALFFAASATGGLAAEAVYAFPVVSGANAGALALLAAWVAPSAMAARAGDYHEGDLLGCGAIAVVLLAMPYARPEVSWLAGVIGAILGLTVGLGLSRVRSV
jgi:membrane associated rhomboid family serine protease